MWAELINSFDLNVTKEDIEKRKEKEENKNS